MDFTDSGKIFYEKIGEAIRNIRKSLKITQNELAEKLNITPQQVSKYEKGEDKISIKILYNIANIFQCDIDVILPQQKYSNSDLLMVAEKGVNFDFSDNKNDRNSKAVEILKVFFKLPKEKQEELIKKANNMLNV